MKPISRTLLLVILAVFLAPIIGGHLAMDLGSLEQGISPLLHSLTSGTEAATFGHALISLLVSGALAALALRKHVIQLPQPRVAVMFVLFAAILFLTIGLSEYKNVSVTAFCEWLLSILTLFVVVATVGRKQGPRLVAGAIYLSCLVVALLGIWEYIANTDPNWRIFGLWHHPNALAGILLLGMFSGLGLSLSSESKGSLLALIGSAVIGAAIGLTQSKGGYLAALIGVVVLVAQMLVYAKNAGLGKRLGTVAVFAVLSVLVLVGAQRMQRMTPAPGPATAPQAMSEPTIRVAQARDPGSAPLARILNAGGTQEQSAGFRFNLWKSSASLIKSNPIGWGIGTFRFESARPGLTTQTQLAHNTYVQLAVEGGPVAALLFVAGLALCLYEFFRGSRKLPAEQNLLRSGIVSGLVASMVHNALDSDLYLFGNNVCFFALLGVALQLSADGVVPEFAPKVGRLGAAFVGVLATIWLLYAGVVDLRFANAFGGTNDFASLTSLAPWDPRVWYFSSHQAKSPQEAIDDVKHSIDLGPNQTEYRRLADMQVAAGDPDAARTTLRTALKMDPNNPTTLYRLLLVDKDTDAVEANKTARALVDLENTTYFKTRALPELIPTEPYLASLYLAAQTQDESEKAEHLKKALQGIQNFAQKTVPKIIQMSAVSTVGSYGSPKEAKTVLQMGIEASKELAQLATKLKRDPDRQMAEAAQRELESALVALDSLPASPSR